MDCWVIDSYGLRTAHSQSVLNQVRGTDQLYVSPLTWNPGDGANVTIKTSFDLSPGYSSQLTIADAYTVQGGPYSADLRGRLRELHGQGMLVIDDEDECDPQLVAKMEASWKKAGLVWRPTNETFSAVITADRLGVSLITSDCDARRLAIHWDVQPMTVGEFASELAA